MVSADAPDTATPILVHPPVDWIDTAVRAGGGLPLAVDDGERAASASAIVWTTPRRPAELRRLLDQRPDLDWVQLPFAGIEPYVGALDHDRVWTCGKDVYSDPVAELALTFLLMGLRRMDAYAPATTWLGPHGTNLFDARVTIVGGGGIASTLARLLAPFRVRLTVVRRRRAPFAGAERTATLDQLDEILPESDAVVLATALTPETDGLLDARRLALLPAHAWVVNVARGRHIVTDDLVAALRSGVIGGAGLDVTDPEPLPDDHPLWTLPNCFVTPHVGNTPEMAVPLLSARVTENVRRYRAGDELVGIVDVDAGY